ncbi:unnamed protein product [Rhizoctonia solani]|uniref:Rho1 guanine nucleotide exchange factor 1 n=1 Tax=Rhizoctonia solani TaxID=456999 RepID=A0A8H3BAA1_9AGAM|nr:unnamed protein product [Rhizoctonia solani]
MKSGNDEGNIERHEPTHACLVGNVSLSRNECTSTTHPPTAVPQSDECPKHRRRPLVYPALLSRIARAFYKRISLSDRTRYGLTYTAAFDGREAVDLIAHIIKTSDRNLALLLGRTLGAQNFFHDVSYYHQLCDSPVEIYQLSWKTKGRENSNPTVRPGLNPRSRKSSNFEAGSANRGANVTGEDGLLLLPSGVFTILTDCYSPTCSKNRVCYSPSCPRRLKVEYHSPGSHGISNSASGLVLDRTTTAQLPEGDSNGRIRRSLKAFSQLWIHSVVQETVTMSDQEDEHKKAIQEIIRAEYDLLQDLEYLRDHWMEPLRTQDIIPTNRRIDFVRQVFWNIEEMTNLHRRLYTMLTARQKVDHDVEFIGDVFLEIAPQLQLFVQYGKHRIWGEHELEMEKSTNPTFVAFVEKVEQSPASRGLGLSRYLTKPTVHLAGLALLLKAVLKYTPQWSKDQVMIPRAIHKIHDCLGQLNEDGENNLLRLNKELVFRPGEEADLGLKDERRQLIYKGQLKHRGGVIRGNDDLQVFLLDHALLMVKSKKDDKHDRSKLFKPPIPLELLVVSVPDEPEGLFFRPDSQKHGYQLTFSYPGREGYSLTLWAPTFFDREKWVECITAQQRAIREQGKVFTTCPLTGGAFTSIVKVNCAVLYECGQRVAYGTERGVYLQALHGGIPVKYLDLPNVQQIDILEEYHLLIVLSEEAVFTCLLDVPGTEGPIAYKVALHVSFFKIGSCLGRTLICIAGASTSEGTAIRIKEVYGTMHGIGMLVFKESRREELGAFNELHIPTGAHSLHFLETQLCVVCTGGFEMLNFNTLEAYPLLDPTDPLLDLVRCKDVHPLAMYQVDGLFLLCYAEFAFYVYEAGRRSKKDMIIHWEGSPTAFALHYPYIMAFDSMFVEIRHVKDGSLVQIIRGDNLLLLYTDTQSSDMASSPTSSNRSGSSFSTQISQGRGKRNEVVFASDDGVMTIQLGALFSRASNESLATELAPILIN